MSDSASLRPTKAADGTGEIERFETHAAGIRTSWYFGNNLQAMPEFILSNAKQAMIEVGLLEVVSGIQYVQGVGVSSQLARIYSKPCGGRNWFMFSISGDVSANAETDRYNDDFVANLSARLGLG